MQKIRTEVFMKNKRIISAIFKFRSVNAALLISCILLLCACNSTIGNQKVTTEESLASSAITENPATEVTTEEATTEEVTTEEITTEETTEIVTEDESTKYKEIKCRTPKDYAQFFLGVEGDTSSLGAVLPDDWKFSRASASTYLIKRDGNTIGKAVVGATGESDAWSIIKSTKSTYSNPELTVYLEKSGTGDSLSFRYRLHYLFNIDGKQRELAITVDYAELSSAAEQKIRLFSTIKDFATDPRLGILADTPFERGILIIGNSFINTSKIGTTLTEMLKNGGKDVEVTAISRGYAHVDTYTNDPYIMDSITRGDFGIVFVCGFYDYDQPWHLSFLKNACAKSGTAVVVFPAHNEPRSVLSIALEENPDLICLDWKAEIDALIKQGVNKWHFCYDDEHLHSTPLGGYVGAHMIYRALYGEMPRGKVSEAVPMEHVKAVLGSYATSGTVYVANPEFIVIFEEK